MRFNQNYRPNPTVRNASTGGRKMATTIRMIFITELYQSK
tara:strand:- start:809 stop:928 length:120 start_codon:yes stop_codon:yes gene_type:complete